MPLFISHLVYLKKFWDTKKYPEKYFYDGLLGSFLPDIRYFTKQQREITHFENFYTEKTYEKFFDAIFKNLNNKIIIDNCNSDKKIFYFKKGFAFHIILDKWWQKQIYFPSNFEKFGLCLKLLNDIILDETNFRKIRNNYLLPYKINFLDIHQNIIKNWYSFIFEYLNTKPSSKNINKILIKYKLLNKKTANKIFAEVEKIYNNKEIKNKLLDIQQNFNWKIISKNQV